MKKLLLLPLILLAGTTMATITSLCGGSDGQARKAGHPVDRIFVDRWSPRAMSGDALSEDELMTLFEAARWAPSSYNGQPWRFVYAHNGTKAWNKLFDSLVEFNQTWVKNAGALILIVSKNTFDHNNQPSRTHSFDTGAAWANLALQGSVMELVVHGMSGFDYDAVRKAFDITKEYTIEAMVAVGKPAEATVLPEGMRAFEKPSDRKAIDEFAFNGEFPSSLATSAVAKTMSDKPSDK